eukprot:gene32080-41288_t
MQASNVMSSNHSASSFNGSAPNLRVKGKISCSEDAHDSVAMGGRSSSRTMKQSASALVVGSVPVPGEDERRRGPGHGGAMHASVGSPTRPLFLWRDQELTLFIVHDNPQLGENVHRYSNPGSPDSAAGEAVVVEADADGLNGLLMDCSPVHLADPSATSSAGPDGSTLSTVCASSDVVEGERAKDEVQAHESSMEVMMESKGEDGLNYFIIGRVAYSGGADGVEDADLTNPRGAQLMACRQLIGYRVNLKSCLTRVTDS